MVCRYLVGTVQRLLMIYPLHTDDSPAEIDRLLYTGEAVSLRMQAVMRWSADT
jgi:hypothetical protein